MPDQPTQRDRIRAVIRDYWGLLDGIYAPEATVLADRIVEALDDPSGAVPRRHVPLLSVQQVGPLLSPKELGRLRQLAAIASQPLRDALRHIDAQTAVIRNQNREMDDQQRRVRELGRLQSEAVRLLRRGGVGQAVGVLAGAPSAGYPLIAELLRDAQAEREGRRG